MTTFTGQSGQNDTFIGSSAADTFIYDVADLDAGDTLSGGGGIDTLSLRGAGTLLASRLAGVTSIEVLTFLNGGISVVFSDAVANANGATLSVTGSSGDDMLDYSAVTLANRAFNVVAGAGNDTFRGGAGYDVFHFNAADLTAGDTISGGGSTDILFLDTAGTVSAASLANVSGVERIVLANGTNSLTLAAGIAAGLTNTTMQVVGGTGNDTISASTFADSISKVDITSGSGIDILTGGTGNDIFRFAGVDLAGDTVNGGAGSDTIVITAADALSAADLAGVSNIDQFTLNVAGSSITLNNAVASANAGVLAIYGSAGNDFVDESAVTLVTRSLAVTALGGSDTFLGGLGIDAFRFNAADLDSTDVVSGGGGASTDAINFQTAGTISAAALSGVSGVERLTFVAGTNTVTVTDALVGSAYLQRVTVYGNTGNDTVDASTLTGSNRIEVYANLGNDTLLGGAGNDLFRFSVDGLTSADTVAGGAGYDELAMSSGGLLTAAKLANVSGIEQITFAVSGLALTLNNAVAAANATSLTLYGSTGNDTVDASAVTDTAHGLNVVAFAGNDSFKGGLAVDVFRFNPGDLTSVDVVSGGGGSAADVIQLLSAGTVAASALANVSGIETVALNVGGISLALSNAMVGSANGSVVAILGSSGNDVVDASAVTSATNRVDINANAGDDTLTGGAGNDVFRFGAANLTATDTVAGGAGSDTILLTVAGSTTFGSNITGIETATLATGGITLALGSAFAGAAGFVVSGSSGNDTVDASLVSATGTGVTITAGAGNDSLTGGAGDDSFSFAAADLTSADLVQGAAGADTLTFSNAGTITAAATGAVSGVETIRLANGTNNLALANITVASATGARLAVIGGTGNDTLDTTALAAVASIVEFTAGTGNDTLVGGAGVDIAKFAAADLTAADNVAGGAGAAVDTVQFTTAGTVGSTAGVSAVELFQLNAGGNSLALTDANVTSATNATVVVAGGSGNDTVNAAAVTTVTAKIDVTAGSGIDTLVGGSGNDLFRFNPGDMTAADTVNGGAGYDALVLGAAGTVSAAQLAGVSNIEQVTLGVGGITLTLDNAAAGANAANLSVIGSAGDDTVDESAVTTPGRAITVVAAAGNDTLRGGAGADIFQFNTANLTAADTVSGGSGAATDILQLLTAGTVTAANLGGVSGIEQIQLANGTNSIVLSDANVTSANGQLLQIVGGTGDDIVNASAVTTAGSRIDIASGGGSDTLIGGTGNDIFRFAVGALTSTDSVAGGMGSDALSFSGAGTIDLTNANYLTGIEVIQLDNNTHTVLLDDTVAQSAGGAMVTLNGGAGADTIDTSRSTSSSNTIVVNTGDGADVLITGTVSAYSSAVSVQGNLGNGDDIVKAYGYLPTLLSGGAGKDTIRIDYAPTGSVVMGAGLTQFETITLTDSLYGNGQVYNYTFTANDTAGLVVNADVSDMWNIHLGNGGQTASGNALADTVLGGTGTDTIYGLAGNDLIDGGGGADVIDAGADNDDVHYSGGATSIAGGAGSDTLHALDGGTFNLSLADQSVGDTTNVSGFENVMLNSFYNPFTGYTYATTGATVTGSSGVNTIEGSDYNDIIDGNGGADLIFGDSGTDRIIYRGSEAQINAYYSGTTYDVGQSDTLVMLAATTVNLNNADQTTGDAVNVGGFQNIDASAVAATINITGDSYDNVLTSGSGAETLTGNDGNDTLDAGAGADKLYGGNGNDRIWYDAADTVESAGADNDTLLLRTAGNINLAAGDQGIGDAGTTSGFEDADASAATVAVTLRGRNDLASNLTGGSGNDSITGGSAGATILGGAGDDTIAGGAGTNFITGGAGKDAITGGATTDYIYYNAGDFAVGETVNGGGDQDYAYVLASNDFSTGTFASLEIVQVYAYDLTTSSYLHQDVTVTFTAAQLAAIQVLYANGALSDTTETIVASVASGSTVDLSATSYAYFSGNDRVLVNGAAGNETIITPNVVATIHGNGGADTLKTNGSSWSDGTQVFGDAGNDRIEYGYTNSVVTLDGGADTDTLYSTYYTPMTINLGLADQTVGDNVTVTNFENVDWSLVPYSGTTIIGSSGANVLTGTAQDDIIDGAGGTDTISAGSGNDRVTYRTDATSIAGGNDNDTLVVLGAANINLTAGDQGIGDAGTLTGFENIDASASSVSVTLRGRNDIASDLIGGSANDTITLGNYGSNFASGGGGNDSITGGSNADLISGDAGADTIIAGAGNDTVTLQAGDIVTGESIDGGADYDILEVRGSSDLSVGTIVNFERLDIEARSAVDNSPLGQNISVTLTGAQASQLQSIYANYYFGTTTETVTINVASGTTANMGGVYFAYFADADSVAINGAAGNETIIAPHDYAFTLHGNAGNDTLQVPSNWNAGVQVFGDAGNDRIDYGYDGSYTLDGGADTDTLVAGYPYASPVINLGAADQTVGDTATVLNFENVDWSAAYYSVTITGSSGANVLIGTNAGDIIDGAGGADTINAGGGDDRVTYRSDATSIAGGDGTDTLVVLGAANINLAAADQGVGDTGTMTGFENVDASASTAAVTLRGSDTSASILIGGTGADTITAGAGTAYIVGGAGADTLVGTTDADQFDIYAGDFIAGESISGGEGVDTLWVHANVDLSIGTVTGVEQLALQAATFDVATYPNSSSWTNSNVSVTMTGAQAQGLSSIQADFAFAESLETVNINLASAINTDLSNLSLNAFKSNDVIKINGSSGDDTFASAHNNGAIVTVHGNAGNDVLHGSFYVNSNGYDVFDWSDGTSVYGDAGNDTIDYSGTTTLLDGGANTDTLRLAGYLYSGVVIDLSATSDQTTGDTVVVTNFENVDARGETYDTSITGSSIANTLLGGFGNDTISGGGGVDLIDGGAAGTDTLTGGAGADTFRWLTRDGAQDSVTDFTSVDDTLQFAASQFDFNGPTFNVAVNDTTGHANLATADLIRYTGGTLDSVYDVQNYLQSNHTGITDGAFIVGKDTAGETLLFHVIDASGANGDIVLVTDFGTGVQPSALQVSDFTFA